MSTPTPPSDDGADSSSFFDGPPGSFQPFLGVRGPNAPTASKPDVDRFLRLPIAALVYGLVNTRGRGARRPRYDAVVLSAFAWLWKQSRGRAGVFTYHDGASIDIGASEFLASIYSVAAVVWTRFHRMPVPAAGLYNGEFRRHYEMIRQTVVRLRNTVVDGVPLLTLLGPARKDVEGKASDAYGQLWTMTGSVADRVLGELAPCGPQDVLFYGDVEPLYQGFVLKGTRDKQEELWIEQYESILKGGGDAPHCDNKYVQEVPGVGRVVDVARLFDVLVARDLGLFGSFVEAAAKTGGLVRTEWPVNAIGWQRRRALGRGWDGAHISVGAWQKGQATSKNRRDRPCTMPYLVADIDAGSPDRALPVVLTLVERLVAAGARPVDLVVAYTGGRGFHVRIPHGLVGRPMYPNAEVARRVVGGFFERLCEGLEGRGGPLIASIDTSLFSPLHLVRAVGSEHEKAPGYRCIGYRGDEFLGLWDEYDYSTVDIVTMVSRSPIPVRFGFTDPDLTSPVPALEAMLRAAAADGQPETTRATESSGDRTASRGIIEAIRRGVRPGEEFAPGYRGRTYAALLLAINLLTHGRLGEAAAWAELERWNAANPVPIGEADGDTDGELERVFDRAVRFVARGESPPFSAA